MYLSIKSVFRPFVDAFRRSRSFSSFGTDSSADRRPPSWNRITDSTHAPPVGNVGGWTPFWKDKQ